MLIDKLFDIRYFSCLMTIAEAVFLGFVQGVTEFLPISSSGHLVISQTYLGLVNPAEVLLFDVLVHFATVLAVILYFREDLIKLLASIPKRTEGRKIILYILAATAVTGAMGLGFRDTIETFFLSPLYVGCGLIITGLLLSVGEFRRPEGKTLSFAVIGFAQGVAITPGISRSGATISTGLLLGLLPEEAVRFSLFISIPTIVGATVLEVQKAVSFDFSQILIYFAGASVAFITGLASIGFLMKAVRGRKLRVFAIYCFLVGGGIIALNV